MWNVDIERLRVFYGFSERLPVGRRVSGTLAFAALVALAVACAGAVSGTAVAHEGGDFEVTGKLIKPEATGYGYGTHALVQEGAGTIYALRSETVDLDRYVGDHVNVSGTKVPEYEGGAVEDGPSLVEVTGVDVENQSPGQDQYSDEPDARDQAPEKAESTENPGGQSELPARLPDTGGIGLGAALLAAGLVGVSLLLRHR